MGIMNRLEFWWRWLTTDPIAFLIYLVYLFAAILISLILHEVAHAYVAYRCGDPTAKMLGRLSLNPLKHLDPVGTLALLFLGFGWARPVPVNPRNFGNYRRDDFLVSIAGIVVNFTLFVFSLALAVAINGLLWNADFLAFYGSRATLSTSGDVYAALISGQGNQLTELMRYPWLHYVQRFLMLFYSINLSLAVFNLLPIPPLDGFHVFNDIILKGRLRLNPQLFQITQAVLMIAMLTGILGNVLSTITGTIENGVLSIFLMITGKA